MDIRNSKESYINGKKVVGYRNNDFDSVAIIQGEFDKPMEFSMNNSKVVTEYIRKVMDNPKFVEFHNEEQAFSSYANGGACMDDDLDVWYVPEYVSDCLVSDKKHRAYMKETLDKYRERVKNPDLRIRASAESYIQDQHCIGFQKGAMTVLVNDKFAYENNVEITNSIEAAEYFPLNGIEKKNIKFTTESGFRGTSENYEDTMLATCIDDPYSHPNNYIYYKNYTREQIAGYYENNKVEVYKGTCVADQTNKYRHAKELDIKNLVFRHEKLDYKSKTDTDYERYLDLMLDYDIAYELGEISVWENMFDDRQIQTDEETGKQIVLNPRFDPRDNKCYIVNK